MKSMMSGLQALVMGFILLIVAYFPYISAQDLSVSIHPQLNAASEKYIGLYINYGCILTYPLTTPSVEEIDVNISFSGPGIRDSSNNVRLSEVMHNIMDRRFQRILEFNPMSAQDAGRYNCKAIIMYNNMLFTETPEETENIEVLGKCFVAIHYYHNESNDDALREPQHYRLD